MIQFSISNIKDLTKFAFNKFQNLTNYD